MTKFIVVGFGHIGRRHATIVTGNPDTELVAIIDSNTSAQDHELYPEGVPFFTSLEDYFKSDLEADVANICTPNSLHVQQALEALSAKMHVVIEKPMGLSKLACEKVIFKSLQVSRNVFVVKQNRYSPPSKWLKEIVTNGTLGDIYLVNINCYWNRDKRYYQPGSWKGTMEYDGGVLFTQFSHFIDIMYWLFGDIKNIQARFENFNHSETTDFEDSGLVTFEFEAGGMGSINFSTSVWDTNMESSIAVVGSKGSVKVGGQYMNEVVYCNVEDYELPELPPTNAPNDYGPFKGSAANHHYVIQNVVDTLGGKDTMTANVLEGMKVVEIIERIYNLRHTELANGK